MPAILREPDPQLGFLWGGLSHVNAVVATDDYCRRYYHRGGMPQGIRTFTQVD